MATGSGADHGWDTSEVAHGASARRGCTPGTLGCLAACVVWASMAVGGVLAYGLNASGVVASPVVAILAGAAEATAIPVSLLALSLFGRDRSGSSEHPLGWVGGPPSGALLVRLTLLFLAYGCGVVMGTVVSEPLLGRLLSSPLVAIVMVFPSRTPVARDFWTITKGVVGISVFAGLLWALLQLVLVLGS